MTHEPTHPRQVGLLYLFAPEKAREFASDLDGYALNVAAAEIQIARLAREGRLVSIETVVAELTCSQDTPGAQALPQD